MQFFYMNLNVEIQLWKFWYVLIMKLNNQKIETSWWWDDKI